MTRENGLHPPASWGPTRKGLCWMCLTPREVVAIEVAGSLTSPVEVCRACLEGGAKKMPENGGGEQA